MGASLYLSPSRLSLVLTPAAGETGNYCPFLEHDEGKGHKLVLSVQSKVLFSFSVKRYMKHNGTSTPGDTWVLYNQHTCTHLSPKSSFVPHGSTVSGGVQVGVSTWGVLRWGVAGSEISTPYLTATPRLASFFALLFFLASHFPHSPRRQLRSSQPLHGYSHAASRLSRYLIRGF